MQWIANPSTSVRLRVPPPSVSPGGEIGRRTRLKILRWQHRAGSIPAPGTIIIQTFLFRPINYALNSVQ